MTEATLPQPAGLYNAERAARLVESLDSVGEAERAFFHDQGYLAVRRAVSRQRIRAASAAVDSLIDGGDPSFRGVQFEAGGRRQATIRRRRLGVRKLMKFVDYHPALKELSEDPDLLGLVSSLMDGQTPRMFQDMALLKPPGGREKPWHQDMAYFNVSLDTPVIGLWIALDEATAANGALHVIPGSHREGPRNHFSRRDWQICDTDVAPGRDVVVPLPPGGILLWHGLTHHGSPVNHSRRRRRALQFHYRPAAAEETTTEERMQVYGGEVRGAEC